MRYLLRFTAICVVTAVLCSVAAYVLVPQIATIATANRGEAEDLELDSPPERSYVFDASGALMSTLFYDQNRASVDLDMVPTPVREAILAVEDENFYSHDGVNLRATLRAFFANVESAGVEQGGSTITMQLVKKSIGRDEQTLTRKVREAVLAHRLEETMSKEEILERYLNTVYFGNGAYGVQAASETYFGTSVENLDWGQAALLAALIRDPNGYEPFAHPDLATERRRIALQRLVDVGDITQDQATLYSFTPLPTKPATPVNSVVHDYFTDEVTKQLLNDPQFNLGDSYQERYSALFQGGLQIYTTLDPTMQQKAFAARDNELPDDEAPGVFAINGGAQNLVRDCPKLNNGERCLGTVAMVSVEPATGAVRALIGGPGYGKNQYNVVTQGPRQPGSSMKPYVLVAALENGSTVYDSINGGTCAFKDIGSEGGVYKPKGHTKGVASLVSQLSGSINCAFVRLGQYVGIDKVISQARKMGVTEELANVKSLPLGPVGITPLEMAGAYASIANDGIYNQPYFIDKITDSSGNLIYQYQPNPTRAMSQETAREANVALKSVIASGTATTAKLNGREAGGKTGTTDEHGDAWFVGSTPQLTTAVWMGSPEGTVPLNRVGGIDVFGGTFPARIWRQFMNAALEGKPVVAFPDPSPPRGAKSITLPKGAEIVVAAPKPPTSSPTTTAPGTPPPPGGTPPPTSAPPPGN